MYKIDQLNLTNTILFERAEGHVDTTAEIKTDRMGSRFTSHINC